MNDVQSIDEAAPTSAPLPRVWPSIVALVGIVPLTLLVLRLVLVVAATLDGASLLGGSPSFAEWFSSLESSPSGVSLLMLPTQFLLLAAALGLASFSRRNWKSRLALDAPMARGKVLAACVAGTLGCAWSTSWLVALVFTEPSDSLRSLERVLVEPSGVRGLVVLVLVGVVPGVCEELFFRGYAQPRLVARFGGWRGIVLPSLFFVLMHLDPQHMLHILPLGLWLGFVAWRTGSTWTSVLCHAVNNIVLTSLAKLSFALEGSSADESAKYELDAPTLGWSLAGVALAALSLRVILRNTQPQVHAPKA